MNIPIISNLFCTCKNMEEYWRAKITGEIYNDAYMQGYYDGATHSGEYHDEIVKWIGDDLI